MKTDRWKKMVEKMDKKADMEEELVDEYFNCSDKERAAFELGIKFGTLFHQFVGTPVGEENKDSLQKAIEEAIERQAYVRSTEVDISLNDSDQKGPFSYETLKGEMIEADILLEFKEIEALGKIGYIEEMDYPLMFIENIEQKGI